MIVTFMYIGQLRSIEINAKQWQENNDIQFTFSFPEKTHNSNHINIINDLAIYIFKFLYFILN